MRDLEGVIENTLIDKLIFGDVMDKSSKLQDMSDSLAVAGLQKSDSMVSDLWSSLYKVAPKIKDHVPSELALNKKIAETLHSLPEWSNLRKSCKLDELTSAIGTLSLGQNISKILEDKLQNTEVYQQAVNKSQEANSLNELAETLQTLKESKIGAGNGDVENITQTAINQAVQGGVDDKTAADTLKRLEDNGLEDALSYVKTEAEKTSDDAAKATIEAMGELRSEIRDALKQTTEETESLSDALKQYHGWDKLTGVGSRVSPEEAFKAADIMLNHPESKKIKEIAMLTGRMSHISFKTKKAKVDVPIMEQWSGVTEGRNVTKLLPQELVALKNPALRSDFLKRFADGKLLQYEIDPYQPAGKGPLVVCIDESGSMNGQREIWAKAVALALLKIAQKERRSYALVRFNSLAEQPEYFHPKKRVKTSNIMEVFSGFLSGGTSFEEPLKSAFSIIKKHKAYKRSDIVFVTDGESAINDVFKDHINAVKDKRKISILTVLIGPDAHGVECFSDYIYRTEAVNMEDGKEVLSIFLASQKEVK